jgi:hypothetical protein
MKGKRFVVKTHRTYYCFDKKRKTFLVCTTLTNAKAKVKVLNKLHGWHDD